MSDQSSVPDAMPVQEQSAVPAEAKTLYMFSDMEGCQVLDRSGNPNSNSIAMCDPKFYSKLDEMMGKEENKNMHVAFLGDYFDQGFQVIPSLKEMSGLYDKYRKNGTNNKNGPDRVFIILGNRDINKLRFMYELTHELTPLTEGGWSEWTKFYNGLAGKTGVGLVHHMLLTSMGATIQDKSKFVGLHSFIPPYKQEGKTDDDALAYLKASFRMGTADDAFDILDFYKKCKIAHVFDLGNGENVLLAHGGGFNKGCFFNKAYVESFGQGNGGNVTPENYLQMMETFRRKLSQPPSVPVQKGGLTDKEKLDRRNKYDIERKNREAAEAAAKKAAAEAAAAQATSVQESVDVYNQLLLDVVTELTSIEGDAKYTWKFVLLQALGLKPDVERTNGNQDKIYNSLVQSCSQNGCTGQSRYVNLEDEDSLYAYLQKSHITHVSYGHKPVCFPIPLMYSRANMQGIMFISNDTSNGNRRTEDLGSTIVVGSMIEFSSNPSDKQSVASICYIPIPGEPSSAKDEEEFKKQFQPFLDLKLNKENAPPYDGANKLTYYNGLVVSMNAEGHNKLNFTSPQSQPQSSEGGRRNRRYTKKIKQRSKRRVQKKRAATRAKRERKTRK